MSGARRFELAAWTWFGIYAVFPMTRLSQFSVTVDSSPLARRLLFHLHSIGWSPFCRAEHYQPFKKPGASVVWVKSGRGVLRIGNSQWRVEPGPCFWFYGTDQMRFFTPDPGQHMVMYSFWFSGPGLESWLEALDSKRKTQILLQHPERVHKAHNAMLRLVQLRPPNWEVMIHNCLSAVLQDFLLSRNLLTPTERVLPPAIAMVLNAIETDRARDWKAADMARIARLSERTFGALFRTVMNESPHAYLQQVRLDMAREKLANPKLLIKEIAGELNFHSKQYFTKFFHKHAGISPTQFRQVYLKAFQSQATPSSKTKP